MRFVPFGVGAILAVTGCLSAGEPTGRDVATSFAGDGAGFVKVAQAQCLDMPNRIEGPAGVIKGYANNPGPNTVVDMRRTELHFAPPGESGWIVKNSDNVCVHGGKYVGQAPRDWGWHQYKTTFDGSGIRVNRLKGIFTWENVILDNSHDGIMLPRSNETPNSAKGVVRSTWLNYTRDDCIENDGATTMVIEDVLMECHMLFSARSGSTGDAGAGSSATIKNVLVHMSCKPDPRTDKHGAVSCGNSTESIGGFWKLGGTSAEYEIHVQDSIILVDHYSRNGRNAYRLNGNGNITYDNVTIVWAGPGEWPGPDMPPGVTITKDRRLWESAEAEWLAQHGCDKEKVECTWNAT